MGAIPDEKVGLYWTIISSCCHSILPSFHHNFASAQYLKNKLVEFYQIWYISDFIWDFGKLPFPSHLGKYIIKKGKSTKIHEIVKIKVIFGLGMTPI